MSMELPVALVMAAFLSTNPPQSRAVDRPPNVIRSEVQGWCWGDVGFNGRRDSIMLNLDQMAAKGIRFDGF